MSIQWKLMAGAMYCELALTILLILPIISPGRWNMIFKSRFLASIVNMVHIYFKAFLAVMALFIVDAIREMRKYRMELSNQHADFYHDNHSVVLDIEKKLFIAQRNLYISGLSIFLWFVLQRLVIIISRIATTEASTVAALAQAKSASAAAQQLLDQDTTEKESYNNEAQNNTANVTNEIKELKEEKRRLEAERDFAIKQAEGVKCEYDQMLEKHTKLKEKLKSEAAAAKSRKDH